MYRCGQKRTDAVNFIIIRCLQTILIGPVFFASHLNCKVTTGDNFLIFGRFSFCQEIESTCNRSNLQPVWQAFTILGSGALSGRPFYRIIFRFRQDSLRCTGRKHKDINIINFGRYVFSIWSHSLV